MQLEKLIMFKPSAGTAGVVEQLSAEPYTSQTYFEKERDAIFRRYWLLVGRADDIPRVGDYFVFDVHICKASILVVRGKDGKIRAFRNACPHRGAKIAVHRRGSVKALRCNFHGWIFDLEGNLQNIPMKETFPGLNCETVGLMPVSVGTWGGFVFINLDTAPKWSLVDQMKPIPEALERYLAEKPWKWELGYKRVFHTNWKTLVEVQVEGYHANSLHRKTITAAFGPDDTPCETYPESIGVPGKISVLRPDVSSGRIIQTPVSNLVVKYGKTAMYAPKDQSQAAADYPGALNRERVPHWVFDDYPLFPNTVFIIQEDQLLIQRAWPLTPDRTLWDLDYYFANEPSNFGEVFEREQGLLQGRDTITEDMTTVEGIHANYKSGAVKKLNLGTLEAVVVSFRKRVDDAIKEHFVA